MPAIYFKVITLVALRRTEFGCYCCPPSTILRRDDEHNKSPARNFDRRRRTNTSTTTVDTTLILGLVNVFFMLLALCGHTLRWSRPALTAFFDDRIHDYFIVAARIERSDNRRAYVHQGAYIQIGLKLQQNPFHFFFCPYTERARCEITTRKSRFWGSRWPRGVI